MRKVPCRALGRDVSALGFGCASLGSRVSAADGTRALSAAFDQGVDWFDVAPAYGDGQAEAVLGAFLRSRRDRAVVCTKVGLVPGRGRLGALKPLARAVIGAAPFLRKAARSVGPKNAKLAITPALIEESLDRSLARLDTGHVDVLALHDPEPDECADPLIIAALEKAVASGKARAIAIAGSAESAIAGASASPLYALAQVSGSALDDELGRLDRAGRADLFRVLYSPFGVGGALQALESRLGRDAPAKARLGEFGFDGAPRDVAAAALLEAAFAANPAGVVLCSMFGPARLQANLRRAAAPPRPAIVAAVHDLLGEAP